MMGCPDLSSDGAQGIANTLRIVDCQTAQTTEIAFGRLFGTDGRLLTALTIVLTIYVALLAIGLLTGRTRIGLAALTPRMLTLGLVLTFATSWAAYQSVVWNLASGAPDQIATLLVGTRGSATIAFADRLDQLFASVADAASQASKPGDPTETGITPAATTVGGFSASTVLWLAATMLLLGTVGVLLTSKIALAALLALGPVCIIFALFRGTWSLFEGWLKAAALFALVPLLTVLIGSGGIALMTPLVRGIEMAGSTPDAQQVAAVFLAASVFVALMVIVLKTSATLVSGWKIPLGQDRRATDEKAGSAAQPFAPPAGFHETANVSHARGRDERVRDIVGAMPAMGAGTDFAGDGRGRARRVAAQIGSVVNPSVSRDHRVHSFRGRRAHSARPARERIS